MSEMRKISYRDAVREAMVEEMRRDEKVFLMGEDIGVYDGAFGVSKGMIEEFGPERVRETAISEQAFVGAGVGAGITGMRPIVELMFSDFMTVCYDQIINQAAKMHFMFAGKVSVPMVIRTAAGGGTGAAAQHSQSLEQMYLHVPGLKVVVPSTPYDAKGLLKQAIRDNNPVIFLEQKKLYNVKGMVPDEDYTIPFGVADVKREGTDVSIFTYGRMVQMSLDVAEKLAEEGINVEVVDPRTLIPLDKELIFESVKKTGKLMLVNDAYKTGGFIGEIAAMVTESEAFDYLDHPIVRLASEDVPVPYARVLEQAVLPDVEKIKATIIKMANKGN